MTSVTSLTLLESMRGGTDENAWQEFFRRYAPMLLSLAKTLGLSDADADDAVAETLAAVHRAFRELEGPFDRSKGRFKVWLCGVGKHKIQDVWRKRKRRARREGVALEHVVEPEAELSSYEEVFEMEWQRNRLALCLERVAQEVEPATFQAFELYAVENKKPAQVAELLDLSVNAVYISKSKVIRRVRELLAQMDRDEDLA